jgi:endonuclease/exonuclease/phosphatase family metal-dependent hydrolase
MRCINALPEQAAILVRLASVAALIFCSPPVRGESFRVATYNVENYLDTPTQTRSAKSAVARAKVRDSILAIQPDVLALQEIGTADALLELRASLKEGGLDLPHWELVSGHDTNVHIAVLSRFPFTARRSQTNENFLLGGRRFRVSRGFGEVDVQVTTNYTFTLITAHLKSKRIVPQADETELRLEEAKLLREKIDARFTANPDVNLIVLGDFNDTKDSASTKAVIGKGRHKLVDTRPAERAGGDSPSGDSASERKVTWTHFYPKEDSYSRIDYILLSPGMAHEWLPNESFVLALPNWGVASDHRPVIAMFEAADK